MIQKNADLPNFQYTSNGYEITSNFLLFLPPTQCVTILNLTIVV